MNSSHIVHDTQSFDAGIRHYKRLTWVVLSIHGDDHQTIGISFHGMGDTVPHAFAAMCRDYLAEYDKEKTDG